MKLDELGHETSFEDIATRYRSHDLRSWFLETRDLVQTEVRPRIIEGGVDVTHDLDTSDGPWAIIIDGDLVTTGDLSSTTDDYATSTLIVTGQLRARNVFYEAGVSTSRTCSTTRTTTRAPSFPRCCAAACSNSRWRDSMRSGVALRFSPRSSGPSAPRRDSDPRSRGFKRHAGIAPTGFRQAPDYGRLHVPVTG
jgi:hypothetical protein